jgi:hypothetical protein
MEPIVWGLGKSLVISYKPLGFSKIYGKVLLRLNWCLEKTVKT